MKSPQIGSMTFRRATRKDFPALTAMSLKLWPTHGTKEIRDLFEKQYGSSRHASFICKTDGKPMAFMMLSLRRDYVEASSSSPVAFVEGIYVDPLFRGKGVGAMLMTMAEKWGTKKGCTELGSDAEYRNEKSQRFHRAVGFKETKLVTYIKKIKK